VTLPRPFRCSDHAITRRDPLTATAPPASRWLLLEHPGPWGPHGLWDVVSHDIAHELLAQAAYVNARVLLIRGPGRRRARGWHWFIADSRPGHERVVRGEFGWMGDMLGIDLVTPPGSDFHGPLYLVCTHGRHDPCCAIRGRPVAEVLSTAQPEQAWECSHVGGDRFAANVVVLPYGIYYGHVEPSETEAVAEATKAGRILLSHYRGRAGSTPIEQAADGYLRSVRDEDRIDAVRIVSSQTLPDGRTLVDLSTPEGEVSCAVSVGHRPVDTPLTCHGTRTSAYSTYAVEMV